MHYSYSISTLLLFVLASFSLMASDKTDIHVHQDETKQYKQRGQNGMKNRGVPSYMNPRRLSNTNDPNELNKRLNRNSRQKRAVTPFVRRWKALIRTTAGFRLVKDGTAEGKILFKIGTLVDAIRDFESLRPTNVENIYSGAAGQVGNQGVMVLRRSKNGVHPPALHVLSGDGAIMNFGIPSPNRVPRTILYFEDMTEAENYLRTVIDTSRNQ